MGNNQDKVEKWNSLYKVKYLDQDNCKNMFFPWKGMIGCMSEAFRGIKKIYLATLYRKRALIDLMGNALIDLMD